MVTKEVIKGLMTNDFDYGQIDFQGLTSAIGEIAIEVMGTRGNGLWATCGPR